MANGKRPEFQEVMENFERQTGVGHGRDLFEPDQTTRLISNEYPISAERFVTVGTESYSLFAFGNQAHIQIHVWENARLKAAAFVMVEDMFSALEGTFVREAKWPEGRYIEAKWSEDGSLVTISEFDSFEQGQRINSHGVELKRSELELLCERLKPLRGFKQLDGVN